MTCPDRIGIWLFDDGAEEYLVNYCAASPADRDDLVTCPHRIGIVQDRNRDHNDGFQFSVNRAANCSKYLL
jgi:hypothetical protein